MQGGMVINIDNCLTPRHRFSDKFPTAWDQQDDKCLTNACLGGGGLGMLGND